MPKPSPEVLVDAFAKLVRAQAMMAKKGQAPPRQENGDRPAPGRWLFSVLIRCGICGRRMSGHLTGRSQGYTCRIRSDYATPKLGDGHPKMLFVSEKALTSTVDPWLSELFAPDQRQAIAESIADVGQTLDQRPDRATKELADVGRRIERLLDAVEARTLDSSEVVERQPVCAGNAKRSGPN